MANSEKEEVILPKYMENTSLAEIIREIADLDPDDLQWSKEPIAKDEQIIGQASDYQKRLYTLQEIAKKKFSALKAEALDCLDNKGEVEDYLNLMQELQAYKQKVLVYRALLRADIIKKYDVGINSLGLGTRASGIIISVPIPDSIKNIFSAM